MNSVKRLKIDNLALLSRFGNDEATNELINRFRTIAKKEAFAMISKYRDISTAEYEDLTQIALGLIPFAALTYDYRGSFLSYWLKIARNEMLDEIKNFSIVICEQNGFLKTRIEGSIEDDYTLACSDDVNSEAFNSLLIEEIYKILSNYKKYGMKKDELEMFKLYFLDGLTYYDISKRYNEKYSTVRSKIHRIKEKIKNILVNFKK